MSLDPTLATSKRYQRLAAHDDHDDNGVPRHQSYPNRALTSSITATSTTTATTAATGTTTITGAAETPDRTHHHRHHHHHRLKQQQSPAASSSMILRTGPDDGGSSFDRGSSSSSMTGDDDDVDEEQDDGVGTPNDNNDHDHADASRIPSSLAKNKKKIHLNNQQRHASIFRNASLQYKDHLDETTQNDGGDDDEHYVDTISGEILPLGTSTAGIMGMVTAAGIGHHAARAAAASIATVHHQHHLSSSLPASRNLNPNHLSSTSPTRSPQSSSFDLGSDWDDDEEDEAGLRRYHHHYPYHDQHQHPSLQSHPYPHRSGGGSSIGQHQHPFTIKDMPLPVEFSHDSIHKRLWQAFLELRLAARQRRAARLLTMPAESWQYQIRSCFMTWCCDATDRGIVLVAVIMAGWILIGWTMPHLGHHREYWLWGWLLFVVRITARRVCESWQGSNRRRRYRLSTTGAAVAVANAPHGSNSSSSNNTTNKITTNSNSSSHDPQQHGMMEMRHHHHDSVGAAADWPDDDLDDSDRSNSNFNPVLVV